MKKYTAVTPLILLKKNAKTTLILLHIIVLLPPFRYK